MSKGLSNSIYISKLVDILEEALRGRYIKLGVWFHHVGYGSNITNHVSGKFCKYIIKRHVIIEGGNLLCQSSAAYLHEHAVHQQ